MMNKNLFAFMVFKNTYNGSLSKNAFKTTDNGMFEQIYRLVCEYNEQNIEYFDSLTFWRLAKKRISKH
jgi:hypothetical protein